MVEESGEFPGKTPVQIFPANLLLLHQNKFLLLPLIRGCETAPEVLEKHVP